MMTRGRPKAARVANAVIFVLALILLAAIVAGVIYLFHLFSDMFGSAKGDVVIVPEVTSKPVAEAEAMLRDRGLIPDVVRRHYDEKIEAGLVTKQNPSANSRRKQGVKVSLWESLGPASFTVPKLTGQRLEDAAQAIAKAGLTLGSVKKVYAEDSPKGRVINQSPEPGREFHTPVAVDMVVTDNTASQQIAMPALAGLRLTQAEERLARDNLHLAKVTYIATDDSAAETVLSQSVPQDKMVPIGTVVELEVALPVELMERRTKTVTIRVPVPYSGPEDREVKIKVFDALNPAGHVEYDMHHSPGDQIEHLVHVEGKATVMIFIDDMDNPYREERL